MRNQLVKLLFFLVTILVWSGCSNDSGGDDDGSGDDLTGGFGSGGVGMDATGEDGGDDASGGLGGASGGGAGGSGDFVACETLSTDLERVATRVMLLEDISSSMSENNKWELAKSAINQMVTAYDSDIEFGLDLFPVNGNCQVGTSVVHDVAFNNAGTINGTLQGTALSQSTPLLLAMENFTQPGYAPTFLDGTGGSYLVIVSDGADSCGADGQFQGGGGGGGSATPEQLGALTTNLRNLFGIRTIVIGFGEGAEPSQLNAIAQAGGTSFNTYLEAGNGDELTSALNDIAEKVVTSCEFQVGSFDNPDIDYDWVLVFLDGEKIGRDDGCKKGDGWSWTSDAHTSIEFCSALCAQLESGEFDNIEVSLACSEDDVLVYE